MQVAEVVIALANLPDWIGPTILTILTIGLPIALILSWFYELTPEGLTLEKDVTLGESTAHITGRRIDFVVIAMLVAGLMLFAWDKWWPGDPVERSIAVLPFVNLSADEGNDYFSDGLTEELINILAKVPEFRVVARTSSAVFKEMDKGVAEIADNLGVAYILEGSVRKSGDRLRITAQLIDAADGVQIWSNSWNKTLTDVFIIQREIAEALVSSLRITMPSAIPVAGTTNPESYDLYLRARHANSTGTPDARQEGVRQLVHALAMDPGFAEAWAMLGVIYSNQVFGKIIEPAEGYRQARAAYERSLIADPKNPRALSGLAGIARSWDRNFAEAERLISAAYEAAPDNISVLNAYGLHTEADCRLDEAARFYRRAIAARPESLIPRSNLTSLLINIREFEAAEAENEAMRALDPDTEWIHIYAGRLALNRTEAKLALEHFLQLEGSRRYRWLAHAYHTLGREQDSRAATDRYIRESSGQISVAVAALYAYQGKSDEAFEWLERGARERDIALNNLRCNTDFETLHDDPRWTELLARLGRDK